MPKRRTSWQLPQNSLDRRYAAVRASCLRCATGDPSVKDAALIASAQRVEHYEIAAYGTLRTLARQVGLNDVATLLQKTLDEEGSCDKKLTAIAESHINQQAAAAR